MTIDNETLLLLNAYHDGELSPGEALSMQRRMENEPELAAYAKNLAGLSTSLVDILPGTPAPERLRGLVLASISMADDEATIEPMTGTGSRPAAVFATARWRSIAAALVIGLVGGAIGGDYLGHVTQGERRVATVENEILAAHLRGLIAPQPFDIASSQSHVVKPWFNGKTTIAPTTPDFTAEGFPLVGGRVDVIGRNPVPVMVYKRRQHTISVTVTAATDKDAAAPDAIDGTNVMNWTFGNLTYWAVSDLNPAELSSFADLYRKQLASGG